MSQNTQAQANPHQTAAPKSKFAPSSPDYAQIDHYILVARQLRARAINDMFNKAFSSLFRTGKSKESAPVQQPHGGTPSAA